MMIIFEYSNGPPQASPMLCVYNLKNICDEYGTCSITEFHICDTENINNNMSTANKQRKEGEEEEEEETIVVKCEPDQDPGDEIENCKYCLELCDPYTRPGIRCLGICSKKIHIECLKRGGVPSPMTGDIFFNLTCKECNPLGTTEVLTRDKLSWFGVVALTLYNLREKSSGISKRGYFHWKSDISTFVDRHWEHLFQKGIKRKKNWVGTISGTLSHFSGVFFKSGTSELGESGWWRLCDNDPPEILIERNLKIVLERKRQAACQPKIGIKQYNSISPTASESSATSFGEDSNCATDKTPAPSMYSRAYVQPTEILSDFLLADDDIPADLEMLDMEDRLDLNNRQEYLSIAEIMNDVQNENYDNYKGKSASFSHTLNNLVPEWISNSSSSNSNNNNGGMLHQSTSYADEKKDNEARETNEEEQFEEENSSNSDCSESIKDTPSSLFTIRPQREWPWKRSPTTADKKPRMSHHEESYLLQSINKSNLDSFNPAIRRIYRKLAVRKSKREYSLAIFDIDRFSTNTESSQSITGNRFGNRVLDRFFCESFNGFFEQRLQGHHEPSAVHSPYTNRVLKPFIRRDATCRPLWLRLMDELCARANKKNPGWRRKTPATIDYCYVRPHHIPAMNSLCSQFFWPGIDLTECLQYPDFSCVVLYKKLLIGFAILVPDVGCNEAYISFFLTRPEWRKSGIGTFMLYHLIQTCMGKDVTLHVSATNPALILYQKFGFKIEEFVQDFYDKYMPPGPRQCRHALLLRLAR